MNSYVLSHFAYLSLYLTVPVSGVPTGWPLPLNLGTITTTISNYATGKVSPEVSAVGKNRILRWIRRDSISVFARA